MLHVEREKFRWLVAYVVFERSYYEYHCITVHSRITTIVCITFCKKSLFSCTHEILNSRFALEHRYKKETRLQPSIERSTTTDTTSPPPPPPPPPPSTTTTTTTTTTTSSSNVATSEATAIQSLPRLVTESTYNNNKRTSSTSLTSPVDKQDKRGYTALMIAASLEDEKTALQLVTMLLKHDANFLRGDRLGFTALHWAASVGNGEVVRLLIRIRMSERYFKSELRDRVTSSFETGSS